MKEVELLQSNIDKKVTHPRLKAAVHSSEPGRYSVIIEIKGALPKVKLEQISEHLGTFRPSEICNADQQEYDEVQLQEKIGQCVQSKLTWLSGAQSFIGNVTADELRTLINLNEVQQIKMANSD